MKSFSKFFLPVVFAMWIVLSLLASGVTAYTMSPSSGTHSSGAATRFTLYAAPPTDNVDVGVVVKIEVNGGTITAYTAGTGLADSTLAGEGCGGNMYTAQNICVDIVNDPPTEGFNSGDYLGTFTVLWGAGPLATINTLAGAYYTDGSTDNNPVPAGLLGSFNITATTTTNPTNPPTTTPPYLPRTAVEASSLAPIVLGSVLVIAGIGLYRSRQTYKYGQTI